MLSVASHIRLAPYLAVTLGPSSHSPPAIDDPPISSPGPIRPTQLRQVNRGASGSSPRDHAGMPATVSRVVACADASAVAAALDIGQFLLLYGSEFARLTPGCHGQAFSLARGACGR